MPRGTAGKRQPFRWISKPMKARVDLSDKEAVRDAARKGLDAHGLESRERAEAIAARARKSSDFSKSEASRAAIAETSAHRRKASRQ